MRADIHDGREHMLQSEDGYIDARPHHQDRGNLLHRTAGPYIGHKHRISVLLGPTFMSEVTPILTEFCAPRRKPLCCPRWQVAVLQPLEIRLVSSWDRSVFFGTVFVRIFCTDLFRPVA